MGPQSETAARPVGREGGDKCRGLSGGGICGAQYTPTGHCRRLSASVGSVVVTPIGTVAVQNPVVRLDVGLANRHDLVVEPGSTTSTCKFDFLSKNNVIRHSITDALIELSDKFSFLREPRPLTVVFKVGPGLSWFLTFG